MTAKEKLIKKLMLVKGANQSNIFGYLLDYEAGYIADFILKAIKPLTKLERSESGIIIPCCDDVDEAINKTLKNLGIYE